MRRAILWGDDLTRWVWIVYGLTQAILAMLLAFDVITSTTPAAVVTGVALIVYVALNELWVRPRRRGPAPEVDHPDAGR
jgi:membrane protein YdbS with pleckstrin-like domain